MDLSQIRKEIDAVDQELVKLLEKRMTLVTQVVAYKKETGKAIFDQVREDAVVEKAKNRVENEEYRQTIADTFVDIMAESRQYQAKVLDK